MADITLMMSALRKADAAGDVAGATRIAQMIKDEQDKASQASKQKYMQGLASNVGPFESLAISAGKGMYDIGRGLGLLDPADESEKLAYQELEKQRPYTTTAGEVVGQSAPFLLPGVAAGGIASTPLRAAAMTGLGAAEGGTIASAEGKSYEDILKTGGITGAISGTAEILFPHIGRVVNRLYRKLKGVDAPTGLFKNGVPTPELQQTMADAGLTIDDVVNVAKREAGADVDQTLTQAQFKKFNAEPTLGELTQDIKLQKPEQFLLEQTTDESGDVLRSFKKTQSDSIRSSVESKIDSLGLPEDVGSSLKDALSGRKALLKENRKKAYEALSQSTKNLDQGVPLVSKSLMAGLPDAGTIRDVSSAAPNQYKALTGLMAEFGIETNEGVIKQLADSGVDITPLNIDNFESFRKRLGNIERSDQTGTIGLLTNPIRKALDDEVDLATKILTKSDNPDVASIAKAARQSNVALKTEFDEAALTEMLIKPKKKGSRIPAVEDSQVYTKLTARSTPIEQVERVVSSVSSNKKALGNLQAATLNDLLDSAFQASSRKIDGVRQFSGAAFQKRYSQLEPKLNIIFKDNPKALSDIKALSSIAAKLTPPSGAVPKGSAGFFIDSMDKLGIFKILNKIPIAGDATAVALRKISSLSTNKKTLDAAINGSPQINEYVKMINRDMPSVGVLLGISAYSDEEQDE